MASTIGPIDKEMELWQKAGVKPAGAWNVTYEKGASGNAPTTRYANERGAYLLMDRATYFTLTKEIGLQVLVERDADLLNYIAVIRMNPAKFPKANAAGAQTFVDWLVSDEAQRLIKSFGVDQLSRQLKKAHLLRWRARAMLWRTERARLAPPIACRLAFGPF
jgi:tungstate transport system substrate-binding protein